MAGGRYSRCEQRMRAIGNWQELLKLRDTSAVEIKSLLAHAHLHQHCQPLLRHCSHFHRLSLTSTLPNINHRRLPRWRRCNHHIPTTTTTPPTPVRSEKAADASCVTKMIRSVWFTFHHAVDVEHYGALHASRTVSRPSPQNRTSDHLPAAPSCSLTPSDRSYLMRWRSNTNRGGRSG